MLTSIQQRLKQVRQREGISQRSMARRLGLGQCISEYTYEDEGHELTVAELLACQQALDVPLSELIDVPEPLRTRAAVLRAYKSLMRLQEVVSRVERERLIDRACVDLEEAMPELTHQAGVRAWPSVGLRRHPDEPSMRHLNIIDTSTLSNTEPYAYAM